MGALQSVNILSIQFQPGDMSPSSGLIGKLNRLSQGLDAAASAIDANAAVAAAASGAAISFAPPTALVGLTAIAGTATTAMRSDAAPAINQAIQPVWTAKHTWNIGALGTSSTPAILLTNAVAATSTQQQFSPVMTWLGQGWTGILSQTRGFSVGARPVGTNDVMWVISVTVGGTLFQDVFAINSQGYITLSTWQGNTVGVAYGGTGNASYMVGDMLYASAATTLTRLSAPTDNSLRVLTSQSIASVPQPPIWEQVSSLPIPYSSLTGAPPIPLFDYDDGDEAYQYVQPSLPPAAAPTVVLMLHDNDACDEPIPAQNPLQNPVVLSSQTLATSATSGSASALPATPQEYLVLVVNGTAYKLAMYLP